MGKQRYNFSNSYPQDEREVSEVPYVPITVLYVEVEQPLHVGRNWVGLTSGLNYAEGKAFLPVPEIEPRLFGHQPVV
jgi:hypothetical protein